MKKPLLALLFLTSFFFTFTRLAKAESVPSAQESGQVSIYIGSLSKVLVPQTSNETGEFADWFMNDACNPMQNSVAFNAGRCLKDAQGISYTNGLLGTQGQIIASLFETQPSSREYFADILENIGVPTISRAYAQGTGYQAMQSFLPFWKVFRNLAYSLYIIMFVVVGIMIMLRTKVNAQTIITIQSALPNLLVTLLLITFSYAIVGFMIDIMYFLIYFVVYLLAAADIIQTPTDAISRLLSYSAWSVIFEGRNSIISACALAIGEVLSGLGTGGFEVVGTIVSMVSIMYLIVAVAFAIAMLKLMVALLKSYIMIIVQTITAPIQILMNAMPGSKAFSSWLKTTASYLLPFPVAASMFILAAVFVGDPSGATILKSRSIFGDKANPFGINKSSEFYSTGNDKIWLPPFTLTGGGSVNNIDFTNDDIRVLIGFFIFLMTPAAVKMAQDWLQVKESPYSAEAMSTATMGANAGMIIPKWLIHHQQEDIQMKRQAALFNNMKSGKNGSEPTMEGVKKGG